MNIFRKRTFTLPLLAESLGAAMIHLPTLTRAMIKPRLTPALREEIMLAVTSVNDCRYCNWVHTGLALEEGVDLDQLSVLLEKNDDSIHESEAVAILFGKHFADTERRPAEMAIKKLRHHFSKTEQREIMAYIHAIYFANLSGNSADALLARLRGRSVDGSLVAQSIAAVLGAPILTAIWANSRRSGKVPMKSL